MLVTPPCGASSNIALWRAKIKPPVELVVGDLVFMSMAIVENIVLAYMMQSIITLIFIRMRQNIKL